jgi:hypothetical protein
MTSDSHPRPARWLAAAGLLCVAVAASACYGAAPPRPTAIALPPLSPGATILVASESTTTIENVDKKSVTCPQGHVEGSPACLITHYTEAEPVTRTATTATYGDAPIDIAQFWVMTDPDYQAKLERLQKLSQDCSGANVPRWIGTGLALGGLVSWGLASATHQSAFTYVGYGALAGGGASYGFGYFGYGGNRCKEARDLYLQIDYTTDVGATIAYGPDRANEMKVLAEQFNAAATRAAGTATEPAPGAAAQ